MKKILGLVAIAFSLVVSSVAFAATAADDVKVMTGGFVRSTPPGQAVTGAFFQLDNKGDKAHFLTSVKSPISPKVELHRTVTEGKDMMTMKPVEKLEIPAHQQLSLQPGGNHVMLMDLSKPVTVGETIKLTLVFEDGSELPVKLLVKDARD